MLRTIPENLHRRRFRVAVQGGVHALDDPSLHPAQLSSRHCVWRQLPKARPWALWARIRTPNPDWITNDKGCSMSTFETSPSLADNNHGVRPRREIDA